MSSNDERDGVTFIWAIENLNDGWRDAIESPVFLSNSLDNTEWKITLNPHGNDDSYISLGLRRCGLKDNGTERIVVDCKLSILDKESSSLEWMEIKNHGFRRGHSWVCQRFVERTEVFDSRKSDYLPFDTLTVSCRLWRRFDEETEAEVRFSRSRIEKICFFWTINDFCSLKPHQRKWLHVKKIYSETPFLTFEFVIEEKGKAEIYITSTEYQRLDFLCYISLIDSFGKVFKSEDTFYSFALSGSDWNPKTKVWGPETWSLISFLNLNKGFLCNKKSLYLPMGILSMHVECFLWTGDSDSTNDNIHQIQVQSFQVTDETKIGIPLLPSAKVEENVCEAEKDNVKYESDSYSRFMHDIQSMYEEGILSDFVLRSSNKEFHVHKSILSARSPVFRAMFTTAMREKESKCIDIPDVDADTLQRMLLFVYLNKMEQNLHWESALNLYFAADKYAIEDLKRASCSLLKAGLCASNACEILVYSDLHGDQDLKSTSKDFIIENDSKIIGSEDWNKLLKSHIHLTVEIFSDLYLKKMKK